MGSKKDNSEELIVVSAKEPPVEEGDNQVTHVIITVKEKENELPVGFIKCRKFFLSIHSEVLHNLFTERKAPTTENCGGELPAGQQPGTSGASQEGTNKKPNVMNRPIVGYSLELVKNIVTYLHTPKLEILQTTSFQTLFDMLRFAIEYQLKGVKLKVKHLICSNPVRAEEWRPTVELILRYQNQEIYKALCDNIGWRVAVALQRSWTTGPDVIRFFGADPRCPCRHYILKMLHSCEHCQQGTCSDHRIVGLDPPCCSEDKWACAIHRPRPFIEFALRKDKPSAS